MTVTADNRTADRYARLIAKLNDPGALYTSKELAWLMGVSAQWARDVIDGEPSPLSYRAGFDAGYRARVAEENAAYPPEPFKVMGTARQDTIAVHRKRSGVDVVEPRPGDFQGLGPEAVEALRANDVGSTPTGSSEQITNDGSA